MGKLEECSFFSILGFVTVLSDQKGTKDKHVFLSILDEWKFVKYTLDMILNFRLSKKLYICKFLASKPKTGIWTCNIKAGFKEGLLLNL